MRKRNIDELKKIFPEITDWDQAKKLLEYAGITVIDPSEKGLPLPENVRGKWYKYHDSLFTIYIRARRAGYDESGEPVLLYKASIQISPEGDFCVQRSFLETPESVKYKDVKEVTRAEVEEAIAVDLDSF